MSVIGLSGNSREASAGAGQASEAVTGPATCCSPSPALDFILLQSASSNTVKIAGMPSDSAPSLCITAIHPCAMCRQRKAMAASDAPERQPLAPALHDSAHDSSVLDRQPSVGEPDKGMNIELSGSHGHSDLAPEDLTEVDGAGE